METSMYSIMSEESDLETSSGTTEKDGAAQAPWYAHLLGVEDLLTVRTHQFLLTVLA